MIFPIERIIIFRLKLFHKHGQIIMQRRVLRKPDHFLWTSYKKTKTKSYPLPHKNNKSLFKGLTKKT